MKASQKSHPSEAADKKPSLRERANDAKATLYRTASAGFGLTNDPIIAAIDRHRSARDRLDEQCNLIDEVYLAERGYDTSCKSMMPRQVAWEIAHQAEIKAWNGIFLVHPTTLAGLIALMRHVGRFADENDGSNGSVTLTNIFDFVADGIEALDPPANNTSSSALLSTMHSTSPVEAELEALNDASTEWWKIYNDSGDAEEEVRLVTDASTAAAKKFMAEMAATHAMRVSRSILIRATGLSASTVRELGLQARLISVELNEWWDDNELADGELACRILLSRLISLAGVKPIRRRDLVPEEARDWLDNPLVHYPTYDPPARKMGKA